MNDKYVKLTDVKRKLRYIFKAYGVGSSVREKIERTLNNLPYSVKGDLETTLEAADVQSVKHGMWKYYKNNGIINTYVCTNCQGKVEMAIDVVPSEFKYCPNCGARMDGKKATLTERAVCSQEESDHKFLVEILAQICDYAVDNEMNPTDTVTTVANNLLMLAEIANFDNWNKSAEKCVRGDSK